MFLVSQPPSPSSSPSLWHIAVGHLEIFLSSAKPRFVTGGQEGLWCSIIAGG